VWLLHADLLVKVAVKRCRLGVHLILLPSVRSRHCQGTSDGSELGHRRKHLIEVEPLDLPVPQETKAHLVPRRVVPVLFNLVLDLVNPLAPQHASTGRAIRQAPSIFLRMASISSSMKVCHLADSCP